MSLLFRLSSYPQFQWYQRWQYQSLTDSTGGLAQLRDQSQELYCQVQNEIQLKIKIAGCSIKSSLHFILIKEKMLSTWCTKDLIEIERIFLDISKKESLIKNHFRLKPVSIINNIRIQLTNRCIVYHKSSQRIYNYLIRSTFLFWNAPKKSHETLRIEMSCITCNWVPWKKETGNCI